MRKYLEQTFLHMNNKGKKEPPGSGPENGAQRVGRLKDFFFYVYDKSLV